MGSHRRLAPSGFDRGAGAALCVLSAAAAALGASRPPAAAAPHDDTRAEVDRLYEQAEQATEAYNEADERADELREEVGVAQDRIARQQERINSMRESLGSLAGAQYRSGGIDPSLALLFSDDPDDYLDQAAVLDRSPPTRPVSSRTSRAPCANSPRSAPRRAGNSASWRRAARPWRPTSGPSSSKLAKARAAAQLPAVRRARRLRPGLPLRPRRTCPTSAAPAPPRPGGRRRRRRPQSALGKPYVWGANGPSGFDCSGLMQWSYAQAGVSLPRTSQAQRYAGRQVPLSQARPVTWSPTGATPAMSAMYMGNGQVVHAPYPGAPVRYDPVGMMPGSSVTRV